MIDTGGPAFPESCNGQIIPGKTLLDDFAGQAMIYYNGRRKSIHEDGLNLSPEEIDALIAKASYLMGEAMIKEKRKREE